MVRETRGLPQKEKDERKDEDELSLRRRETTKWDINHIGAVRLAFTSPWRMSEPEVFW